MHLLHFRLLVIDSSLLEFVKQKTLIGGWNATLSQVGSTVTASNPANHWNGTIQPNGGSVTFGLQATHNVEALAGEKPQALTSNLRKHISGPVFWKDYGSSSSSSRTKRAREIYAPHCQPRRIE